MNKKQLFAMAERHVRDDKGTFNWDYWNGWADAYDFVNDRNIGTTRLELRKFMLSIAAEFKSPVTVITG